MQNVLDFFRSFFQQITRLLKGGDNWFLVIDEEFVAQEISALQDKKYDNNKIQNLRQDDFNRQYELNRRLSKESITLGELWSTLSPISIFRFLKYTLSDVVWIYKCFAMPNNLMNWINSLMILVNYWLMSLSFEWSVFLPSERLSGSLSLVHLYMFWRNLHWVQISRVHVNLFLHRISWSSIVQRVGFCSHQRPFSQAHPRAHPQKGFHQRISWHGKNCAAPRFRTSGYRWHG